MNRATSPATAGTSSASAHHQRAPVGRIAGQPGHLLEVGVDIVGRRELGDRYRGCALQ